MSLIFGPQGCPTVFVHQLSLHPAFRRRGLRLPGAAGRIRHGGHGHVAQPFKYGGLLKWGPIAGWFIKMDDDQPWNDLGNQPWNDDKIMIWFIKWLEHTIKLDDLGYPYLRTAPYYVKDIQRLGIEPWDTSNYTMYNSLSNKHA